MSFPNKIGPGSTTLSPLKPNKIHEKKLDIVIVDIKLIQNAGSLSSLTSDSCSILLMVSASFNHFQNCHRLNCFSFEGNKKARNDRLPVELHQETNLRSFITKISLFRSSQETSKCSRIQTIGFVSLISLKGKTPSTNVFQ